VIVEESPSQKTDSPEAANPDDASTQERSSEKHPAGPRRADQSGLTRTVRLLVILNVLLLASSIASLIVSHRACESSLKQLAAVEQLTQSIRDTQKSIMNLSRMLEQSSPEEEEFEEDRAGGPSPDGSI
jgi:hypothetical protein